MVHADNDWIFIVNFIIVNVKFSMAKSLPVENLLPQNVGSIINNCIIIIIIIIKTESAVQGRELNLNTNPWRRWSLRLGRWTATTVQKTAQKPKPTNPFKEEKLENSRRQK